MNERIFSGVFPCGIAYADRTREVAGDYARLAFLPFATLELEFDADCPESLRDAIRADASEIQSKRGESYVISSCGQTVVLGAP